MTPALPKWLSFRSGSRHFLFHTESPRLLVSCGPEAAVYFFDPAELSPSMEMWLREVVTARGHRVLTVTVENRDHLPRWLKGRDGNGGFILHLGTPPFLGSFSDAHMAKVVWLDGGSAPRERDELQRSAQAAWMEDHERSLIT